MLDAGVPPAAATELAIANRILAHHRIIDAFGHVSMRHPTEPDRYLLSRSMAGERVMPGDILQFTLDSELISQGDHSTYIERFIHGAIYAARPEVMSVVHSHSHSVLPLGVTKAAPLRSVCHMGSFLGVCTPVFEIRDFKGDGSDLLVRDAELGDGLASTLGDSAAVLMRGHGITVVGTSLYQAVFRSVYAEMNAKIQLRAMQLGPVNYLTEQEAAAASGTNDGAIGRAWDAWLAQIGPLDA